VFHRSSFHRSLFIVYCLLFIVSSISVSILVNCFIVFHSCLVSLFTAYLVIVSSFIIPLFYCFVVYCVLVNVYQFLVSPLLNTYLFIRLSFHRFLSFSFRHRFLPTRICFSFCHFDCLIDYQFLVLPLFNTCLFIRFLFHRLLSFSFRRFNCFLLDV
jgi:hypothetical protein